MSERNLYRVECKLGVGIVAATSDEDAEEKQAREFGNFNAPYTATLATEGDIAYVRAMGGRIPVIVRPEARTEATE